jgi:hypothetical protein
VFCPVLIRMQCPKHDKTIMIFCSTNREASNSTDPMITICTVERQSLISPSFLETKRVYIIDEWQLQTVIHSILNIRCFASKNNTNTIRCLGKLIYLS